MIVRLVSLKARPDKADELCQLLERVYPKIRQSRGCRYLQFLTDNEEGTDFFTVSHWDSVESLDEYRHSDFFRSVWPRVKECLRDRAWAQSYEIVVDSGDV